MNTERTFSSILLLTKRMIKISTLSKNMLMEIFTDTMSSNQWRIEFSF